MRIRPLAIGLVAVLAVALVPELARACSVCSGGSEQSRTAFIVTTAFLSILPPLLVGGFAFWLRARARQQARTLPLTQADLARR